MPNGSSENSIDAYAPAQVAAIVENIGVAKASLPIAKTLVLAVLAGAFIAFGGMFYTVAVTETGLGFGPTRLIGGMAFSLGLVLVVVAGAELFTGNNLIVMAWASRRIGMGRLLRNWGLVYLGNLVGAVATAVLVHGSGVLDAGEGMVAATARGIASAKVALPFGEAFLRGMLCNTLVCLAVWLCVAAHSVSGKILAILFPITAFVALGFEHSVANMYLIPAGAFAGAEGVTLAATVGNLVPVTLGNIVGGSALVALVYWIAYLRKDG
ncbi:MAG: formate/nitrite transporter family protein [Rhodospirillaceae bacterium]|nr:formate/nitrite transporter family protein [Rhodospirillaceae bacterium]